jgi:hypothetical protein
MAKKSTGVKVEKCACSKCGQVSNAAPNTPHAVCRGFRLLKPLPAMFAGLRNPVKGIWTPVVMGVPVSVEVVIEKFVS